MLAYKFAKCWPIFQILSPSAVKLAIKWSLQIPIQTHRYTTLWNVNVMKLAIIWKKFLLEIKLNLMKTFLTNVCHSAYSKFTAVARMQHGDACVNGQWRRQ